MISQTTQIIIGVVVFLALMLVLYFTVYKKKSSTPTATAATGACKVNTDCTSPQVCVSNACSDPTTPTTTTATSTTTTTATADNGQACKVNSDCTSGNCVNSVCGAAPTTAANGQPCKAAGDCTSGFCVNSVCSATAAPTTLADGQACTADNDCTGAHCYYGVCATTAGACSTTSPCADASTHDCVNGACLVRPAAYGCSPGCAGAFVCNAGACVAANDYSICNNVTCPSGQVCDSSGACVSTAAVYSCKTNKDCIQPVGPDSVCNSLGYCSCSNDLTEQQNTACIGGTTYSTGCSGTAAYAGLYNALDGYTCTGYNFRCAGVVCPYGQSCTNGVCK